MCWLDGLRQDRGARMIVADAGDGARSASSCSAAFEGRMAHSGDIFIAVHDAWHGRGVGQALMEAALDVADNWMGLIRLQLEVHGRQRRRHPALRALRFPDRGTCPRRARWSRANWSITTTWRACADAPAAPPLWMHGGEPMTPLLSVRGIYEALRRPDRLRRRLVRPLAGRGHGRCRRIRVGQDDPV